MRRRAQAPAGLWACEIYFDEEGSVMPSTVVIAGSTCWRTGYNEDGQWIRLPDAVELAAAEARAKELTEAYRAARR